MKTAMMLLMMLSTLSVLNQCINLAAVMNRHEFPGHRLRFIGIALSYALIGGGAVATLLHWHAGSELLLLGVGGLFIFERRGIRR